MDPALKAKADALKPFLTDYLDRLGVKKNGGGNNSTLYHCPLCGSGTGPNRSGAFSVFNSKMNWCCHACGKKGDIVDLHRLLRNDSDFTWGRAVKELGDMFLGNIGSFSITTPKTKETVRSCIASVDKRNAFYIQLLGHLALSEKHRTELVKRGMPDAELWKYRSVPDRIYSNTTKNWLAQIVSTIITEIGDTPNGVPGFYINDNGEWTVAFPCQGFLVPVCDLFGRIQGLQVRADVVKNGRKYCWVSSNPDPTFKYPYKAGTCAEAAIHCHFASTPSDTLYLTEGPLKGDIAAVLLNRTFIAIPGTTCLSSLSNVLAAFKKRGFIRVVCALDMDRFGNENVLNAVHRIQNIVTAAGLEWFDFVWNPNYMQDGLCKGIDDWAVSKIKI